MKILGLFLLTAALFLAGCIEQNSFADPQDNVSGEKLDIGQGNASTLPEKIETATFAGGCFWCLEAAFEGEPGVIEAVSGYSGGHVKNPSYRQVVGGTTGHYESVQVSFDASQISFEELLTVFWRQIDPTDDGGQFVDRGPQYRTAVFYHDEGQKSIAEKSKTALRNAGNLDGPVVTEILPLDVFYEAEEYHQNYYKKSSAQYWLYEKGSGRDSRLGELWGDEEDLKKKLTARQFEVTQLNSTEPPFNNEYWDNKDEGIYVDVVSGEALFSSKDKFVSGTGWPSFSKPLEPTNLVFHEDTSFFLVRTEIRSKEANSHLGHLFKDGPAPTGERYCINSASLKFIPVGDLEGEGYGEYADLFEA